MPTEAMERGKIEGLDGVCGFFVVDGGSGADAEEGEGVAFGVCDEVTGGVGYAVDFMEGIREIGDAGRTHWISLPCPGGVDSPCAKRGKRVD